MRMLKRSFISKPSQILFYFYFFKWYPLKPEDTDAELQCIHEERFRRASERVLSQLVQKLKAQGGWKLVVSVQQMSSHASQD